MLEAFVIVEALANATNAPGAFSNVTLLAGLHPLRLNPIVYVPAATPMTSPPCASWHACCGVAQTVDALGSPILLADRAHATPELDPAGSIQTFAATPPTDQV